MHSNRLIGALFFVVGAGLFGLTSWIIHHSGVRQGGIELGLAAIAVHVVGVVVFGLAAGALAKGGNRGGAALCGLVVLLSAAYSAYSVAAFAVADTMAVTRAREAAERQTKERHDADLKAKAERQKTQAKLAEQQLKWLQNTTRDVDSRRERKEMVEAGGKLIAEMGKGDAPSAPPVVANQPPPATADALTEMLAAAVAWQQGTIQLSVSLYLALMLIVLEVPIWPMGSYFWRRPVAPILEIGPAPAEPAPRAPPHAQPAALDAIEPVKRLPAPVAPVSADGGQPAKLHPARVAPPPRIERRPVDEWAEAALKLVDFPVYQPGKRVGPLRGKQDPKTTARRFALWMQATGLDGSYSSTEIATHYREFAEWDHREAIAYNNLAAVLPKAPGVTKTNATLEDGSRALRWVVAARKFRPAKKDLDGERAQTAQDDAPAAEGGRRVLPFGDAPRPAVVPMRLQMLPLEGEPAWLHANRKAMRRWRIEMTRKQRKAHVRKAA
jgi:hypothetical protein